MELPDNYKFKNAGSEMKLADSQRGRIVLSTFGSLGDINPFIALALGLQQRGYRPVIATIPFYRDYVADAGLPFYPIRPDLSLEDKDLLRRAEKQQLIREVRLILMTLPILVVKIH